ncbi:hypothetical protein R75465_07920 [Paraburkholderia aspalathi]|nr:hypothetical protein R75465_07920 [Paraburkholderia aspalathi]
MRPPSSSPGDRDSSACRSPGDVVFDCGIQPGHRAVSDASGRPQLPCHWLAPDAAAALPGLMAPAAAGLFIIALAPVAAAPASVLLSARLHPGAPVASSMTDAAIAMCFMVSFISHSSRDCLEPGPGRRISSTPDGSRSLGNQQIARLTFDGTNRSWIVRNEFSATISRMDSGRLNRCKRRESPGQR